MQYQWPLDNYSSVFSEEAFQEDSSGWPIDEIPVKHPEALGAHSWQNFKQWEGIQSGPDEDKTAAYPLLHVNNLTSLCQIWQGGCLKSTRGYSRECGRAKCLAAGDCEEFLEINKWLRVNKTIYNRSIGGANSFIFCLFKNNFSSSFSHSIMACPVGLWGIHVMCLIAHRWKKSRN